MRCFLALGEVLTVLASGASRLPGVYSSFSAELAVFTKERAVSISVKVKAFSKSGHPVFEHRECHTNPVHRRGRGSASEVAKPGQFNDRFCGGSSSALPAQLALDSAPDFPADVFGRCPG